MGADAVDELRQFYEIKMSSSSEFPDEVTLTQREVQAAGEPDFFRRQRVRDRLPCLHGRRRLNHSPLTSEGSDIDSYDAFHDQIRPRSL